MCVCVYSLEDNELGAAGAGALAEALKLNVVLTHLDLSKNALTNYGKDMSGIQALAAALSSGSAVLTSLDISENDIGPELGVIMAEVLEKNLVLTNLNLSGNSIGGYYEDDNEFVPDLFGVKALSDALALGRAVLTTLECVFGARTRESRHNSCTHVFSSRARSHQYHGFRPMCPFAI